MGRTKKDLIVKVAGETIKLREGETRTVHLPMTLRLVGGILYFTPPSVISSIRRGQPSRAGEDVWDEDIPDGAPPEGNQSAREYEKLKREENNAITDESSANVC